MELLPEDQWRSATAPHAAAAAGAGPSGGSEAGAEDGEAGEVAAEGEEGAHIAQVGRGVCTGRLALDDCTQCYLPCLPCLPCLLGHCSCTVAPKQPTGVSSARCNLQWQALIGVVVWCPWLQVDPGEHYGGDPAGAAVGKQPTGESPACWHLCSMNGMGLPARAAVPHGPQPCFLSVGIAERKL